MIIDYRHLYWGHNHWLKQSGDKDEYAGLCINEKTIKTGDIIIWPTNYGHVEAEVVESKWHGDPIDMYTVRARVVKRVAGEGIDQKDVDEHFSTHI